MSRLEHCKLVFIQKTQRGNLRFCYAAYPYGMDYIQIRTQERQKQAQEQDNQRNLSKIHPSFRSRLAAPALLTLHQDMFFLFPSNLLQLKDPNLYRL
jgi:hypothetical protein